MDPIPEMFSANDVLKSSNSKFNTPSLVTAIINKYILCEGKMFLNDWLEIT